MPRILLIENALAPLEVFNKDNIDLVEHSLSPSEKDSIAKDKITFLVGPIQAADTRNGNNRIYPRKHLERALNEYNKQMKDGGWGHRDHPEHEQLFLNDISHFLKEWWWDGNTVMGKVQLLPEFVQATLPVRGMIMVGKRPGISSRAMGSVSQEDDHFVVENDLQLYAFDLVVTPSTPKAYLSISEGLKSQYNMQNNIGIELNAPVDRIKKLVQEIRYNKR